MTDTKGSSSGAKGTAAPKTPRAATKATAKKSTAKATSAKQDTDKKVAAPKTTKAKDAPASTAANVTEQAATPATPPKKTSRTAQKAKAPAKASSPKAQASPANTAVAEAEPKVAKTAPKAKAPATAKPTPKAKISSKPAAKQEATTTSVTKADDAAAQKAATPPAKRAPQPKAPAKAKQPVKSVQKSNAAAPAKTTKTAKAAPQPSPAKEQATAAAPRNLDAQSPAPRNLDAQSLAPRNLDAQPSAPRNLDEQPSAPRNLDAQSPAPRNLDEQSPTPSRQPSRGRSRNTSNKINRPSKSAPAATEAATDEQAILQTIIGQHPALIIEDVPLDPTEAATDEAANDEGQPEKRKKGRSRRGRGKKRFSEDNAAAIAESAASADDENTDDQNVDGTDEDRATNGAKHSKQEQPTPQKAARRKMFVSIVPEEQIEVVLTEEGQVQEYYVDMLHQAKTKGNIYKGVIHNVDPNLQAAFVNYGAVKNGFLQIDEIHPEYYTTPHDAAKGRKYPPIQRVLKPGQEVLVQVVKEPAGTKGAFLTTYLSIPGRFLVLTPGREQIGVSRKVDNETERTRLRDMLDQLNPGAGLGVIVRTVSMGASLENLQSDLAFLQRTWSEVRTRGTSEPSPSLVYQEFDLATRAVRDYLTDQVIEVWVDDEEAAIAITDLANNLFPRKKNLVRLHKDSSTLFDRFNLQKQLSEIHSREVSLPSGGRLVIDPTEALTAIDINSGRSSGKSNFEDMAYRTNMDAAKMIPLQLRLRDIGGQVVVDFIEMRDKNHWREVEKTVRQGMKNDRARYDVGKISTFGMMEIVRQRLGSSALSVSTEPCPHCKGTGVRRNMEWQSQQALRDIARLMRAAQNQEDKKVIYETDPALALHLLNSKRQRLLEMEQLLGVLLDIRFKQPDVE